MGEWCKEHWKLIVTVVIVVVAVALLWCGVGEGILATLTGLVAIENIKAGDMVLSTDPETMETGYKPVVETYIRDTDELVHLVIDGEEIISTFDHPYYVPGTGFVSAVDLCIGTRLINSDGKELVVEEIYREKVQDDSVKVYNFQVEDYNTYYVGNTSVLVHNAGDVYKRSGFRKSTHEKAKKEASRNENGEMICPTCGEVIPEKITINTKNGTKSRVGYDLDHYPSTWAERISNMKQQSTPPTRKTVLDVYNKDVRVQCPKCNQGHKFEGIKGEFAK